MSTARASLQSVDLGGQSPVSRYLRETSAVCPFIEPAARAGLLFACEVTPDCQIAAEIHPRLFEQLIPCIEQFREHRGSLPDKQQRLLVCYFVVIRFPPTLDADAVRLLAWPNWVGLLLKQLYTPKEIVIGTVRKTVAERSTCGTPVPIAPFHAIIIRSRVVGSDSRFFTGNQPLLQAMMEADDDGADVHAGFLDRDMDIRDPQAIRDSGYFERVKQMMLKTLSEPGKLR
jgi:hypothetical protein